jgi:hypothetical protein
MTAPPTPDLAAARRALLRMVILVAALDAVAIGGYYAAHIARAPMKMQQGFTIVWVLAVLAIVAPNLRAIRVARRGGAPRR